MLQTMRQNIKGPTTKIVVWLIVISFSIFGIESILVGGGGGGVAEVNGEEVSPQELQQAINTQKRRLIAMMGDNLDPAMLDDEFLSAQALDSLIGRKLLMQSAESMDLAVSKREIGSVIGNMEQFQIEGKFSKQLFSSVLSGAGFTPAYFKDTLREDIALTQLRSGLMGSEFSTSLELLVNAEVSAEQRDLQYLTIPMANFLGQETITEEQVQAYYDQHQDEFRTQESVELDYIELALADYLQPVAEEAIREAYQLEIENNQYRTESRVSHILFEAGTDESEDDLQQRIKAAQAQLASGTSFSEVAGEYSDDIGSAASGGDLGYTSGDAFPPEMEEAIAQLEPDTVSEPVRTDAGIHLILVTDRKEGSPPGFEELRPQLEEQLQSAEARVELLRTVEELRDLVFNAENLAGPADNLELEVKRSGPVSRAQATGLFATPSVLAAAFSEDVLEAGHNSEVIELSDNRFVVVSLRKHNLPEVMALADVRDEINAILVESAARAQVAAAAEQAVQQLRSGSSIEELATAAGYPLQVELAVDRGNSSVPPEVLTRAFELPAPGEGEVVVDMLVSPAGDAQVVTLLRASKGRWQALEPAQQMALQRQVTTEYANLLNTEYQRGLRDSADISVM